MQIISIFFIFIWDLTDLTFTTLSLMFILHALILEILDVFYLTNESGFFFMYRLWSGLHHISSISKNIYIQCYLLLFLWIVGGIIHIFHFSSALSQSLNLF